MNIASVFLVGLGICFLMLGALLAHEGAVAGEKSPMGCLRAGLGTAVSRMLLNYDRDPVFGALVPFVLFVVLPGAAAVNALLGGSPMLIICYGLIALSVIAHLLVAESASMAVVRAILSAAAALLALVIVPFYAVWSLSEHQMHAFPAQAALSGLLISIILYAGDAGFWSLLRARAGTASDACVEKFIAAFLFALPFGYVLFWFMLVIVAVIAGDSVASAYRNWPTLLLFVFSAGIAFAMFNMLTGGDPLSKTVSGKWTKTVVSTAIGIAALLYGLSF